MLLRSLLAALLSAAPAPQPTASGGAEPAPAATTPAAPSPAETAAPGPQPAGAAPDKPRLLVLQLQLDSGVDPEVGRQLENLLITYLRAIERHQVMSQADIVTMLGVEQQKQLTGCEGDSCMAELGGALGAELMVSGNIGLLGDRRIVTLKLLAVNEARIDNQITRELPGDDNDLAETMRVTAYDLLKLEAPVLVAPWYKRWWVWTLAGVLVVGGVTAGVVAATTAPPPPPGSNLGIITF